RAMARESARGVTRPPMWRSWRCGWRETQLSKEMPMIHDNGVPAPMEELLLGRRDTTMTHDALHVERQTMVHPCLLEGVCRDTAVVSRDRVKRGLQQRGGIVYD